jgi:SecD/SecF fusion protein
MRGKSSSGARGVPQALVLIDYWNVSGEYIRSVSKGVDEAGRFAVNITFNHQGAGRMRKLTSLNLPNQATGARRYLGIILDKRMVSAPSIETTVSNSVQISGRKMEEAEVDEIVSTLQEGKLPSPLREISEPGVK